MSYPITTFGGGKSTGLAAMVAELGGKGAGLCEMSNMGLPVPPGFIIPTGVCRDYFQNPKVTMQKIMPVVFTEYQELCGSAKSPHLLVSVRSGAPISCPGMLDTLLNVGLTEQSWQFWTQKLGFKAAENCQRRLIQMFGESGYGVPSTVEDQLEVAVEAVFKSWNNERAKTYRKLNCIDDTMGTAVTIQTMVFGNLNDNSGSGVLFTRHPSTGAKEIMGEFLPNAQGEDVVSGTRTPFPMSEFGKKWPTLKPEIAKLCGKLEGHYNDMMDVEFTVQDGELFVLQCRVGKRSSLAAIQIAHDFHVEGYLDLDAALSRFTRGDVKRVLQPQVDPSFKVPPNYVGIGSTVGVAVGLGVLSADAAIKSKTPVILVRDETDPNDIGGMAAAVGILTRTGGATSHAAVIARAMNKPAVVGCTSLPDNPLILEYQKITIDGASGNVWFGVDVPMIDTSKSPVVLQMADLIAQRDKLMLALSLDQFIGIEYTQGLTVGCDVLVTNALECNFEQAQAPCWNGVVVDVRTDRSPQEPDGLGDLFALAPAKEATFLHPCAVEALEKNGARFMADGSRLAVYKELGYRVEGPADSISEMLYRKTLDASPSLMAQFSSLNEWKKTVMVLAKAGFSLPVTVAVPPAYVLMFAVKE